MIPIPVFQKKNTFVDQSAMSSSCGGMSHESSSSQLGKSKGDGGSSHQQHRLSSSAWAVGSTMTTKEIQKDSSSKYCSSSPEKRLDEMSLHNDKNEGVPSFSILSSNHMGHSSSSNNNDASFDNYSQSVYHDRLIHQPSTSVESVLAASCEAMAFDIAEVWLRTGAKSHRLINSHLRPASLEDSERNELVEVYYGERSSERTHRLSPTLCKRAKEARDVVWLTTTTITSPSSQPPPTGEETAPQDASDTTALLRSSISDVQTAVAVPICHESSRTNLTFLFFSMRRTVMHPSAVEFLVHMSLSAAVASVNFFVMDIYQQQQQQHQHDNETFVRRKSLNGGTNNTGVNCLLSSVYLPTRCQSQRIIRHHDHHIKQDIRHGSASTSLGGVSPPRPVSITGAFLDLKWNALSNVEYLTDGGNSWIHTAVMNGRAVVVKTLKPECQDVAMALNEIEAELAIHAKLNHPHIVSLCGAGLTSKGVRFVVLDRLDGGTLSQMLGYDHRIRDRRRRFWMKRHVSPFSYVESLTHARDIADALAYCQSEAIPGTMCLHRDLKPDNVGFTLDGKVKLIDFGLARLVENASPTSQERYEMSGETGSLRYMAPEVADGRPYNHKADVYSFGIMFWELLNQKQRPYEDMSRDNFYRRVVTGKERPPIPKKWPQKLANLVETCWDHDIDNRPTFRDIVNTLNEFLDTAKPGSGNLPKKKSRGPVSRLIDRHSTWF